MNSSACSETSDSSHNHPTSHQTAESSSQSRQSPKRIMSTAPILKHLGLGSTRSDPRNANKLVENTQLGTSAKYKVSGTKVKEIPAKSQAEADETFEDTFKIISEDGEQCSSVITVEEDLSVAKGCSLPDVVDNIDECSAPTSSGKCRNVQAKRSKLKDANAESPRQRTKHNLNSWRNEFNESNKEASNSNGQAGQLQQPHVMENKFSREPEMLGHMGGYIQQQHPLNNPSPERIERILPDFRNDHSFPTSFGKKKAPHITKLNHGPAKIKDGYASSKQKSNQYHNSPPLLPFDICESEREVLTSTEAIFTNDEQQGSETCQPNNGDYSRILRPGMVLLKGYLKLDEQVSVVRECRNLGLGPGGFYQPGYKYGAKLRLMMMCLGRDWDPQTRRYSNLRRFDNSRPPCIPHQFVDMVNGAMDDSHALTEKEYEHNNATDILPTMSPNICIVNFYTTTGRLGLHQDRDESPESLAKGLPVVSISVGDSAEFLYGDERDISKADKLVLESGDVLIFGGQSRHIFHGVESIIPDTAPESLLEETRLLPGRLNLTFRQF